MTAIRPLPGTSVPPIAAVFPRPAQPATPGRPSIGLAAAVATISHRMRLNIFAHRDNPEPRQPSAPQPPASAAPAPPARPNKTYPADLIVWGIVIRSGFDEMDDPWYHRGVTQHAYVEGNDLAALCGFRPPISGPRERRRPRLGLPSAADHPMCGTCARMVVAPRPRVPVPVQPFRPAVAVPVAPGTAPMVPGAVPGAPAGVPSPVAVAPRPAPAPIVPGPAGSGPAAVGAPPAVVAPAQGGSPQAPAVSPWVKRHTPAPTPPAPVLPASHDAGLMARGVHLTDTED
jgi:hypothetical protein